MLDIKSSVARHLYSTTNLVFYIYFSYSKFTLSCFFQTLKHMGICDKIKSLRDFTASCFATCVMSRKRGHLCDKIKSLRDFTASCFATCVMSRKRGHLYDKIKSQDFRRAPGMM